MAVNVSPGAPEAIFLVREPWPSQATGTALSSGRLGRDDVLLVVSRMNEGGVVFADGMEGDRLDFAWGRTLRLSVDQRQLRFVPGAARQETAPAPVRRQAAATAPPKPVVIRAKPKPVRFRLVWMLLALLALFWLVQILIDIRR